MDTEQDRMQRPLMVYDGSCRFCRKWITYWKQRVSDAVDCEPAREASKHFPHIPPKIFERSIVLVDRDETVYQGANAIFKALALAGKPKLHRYYRRYKGFAWLSERTYGLIARNRILFSWIT